MKRGFLLMLVLILLLSGCRNGAEAPKETEMWSISCGPAESHPSETDGEENAATESVPENTDTQDSGEVAVTSAPTEALTEETTLPEPENTDFARITDYIPDARLALAYATADNFTGQTIYDFTDAYLRYGTLCKLVQAADVLRAQGYGIVIWDAYRPVWAQQALWDICPDPNYVSAPGTGTQSHCRGCAVDITLYDLESGALLEMPTGFDDFTRLADRDYSDVSETAAANARLLENILSQAGFKPYFGEWWHFTDTDIADYDIPQDFDPAA